MQVGGIETNLVRLSRALLSRRHSVTVVSSGGPLVRELERSGVEHLTTPVTWHDPLGVMRTVVLLRRIAASYDIVHTTSATANVATRLARVLGGRWRTVSSPMGIQNSDNEPKFL